MNNGIESIAGGRAQRFVLRNPAELPVKPPSLLPPMKCRDCGAVDIWCRECDTGHPIRGIDDHVHIAHCWKHQPPSALRQACALAGKAETDAAHDQLAYERKREITAATIGVLLGFLVGVALTLATLVVAGNYYGSRPVIEQPIEQ